MNEDLEVLKSSYNTVTEIKDIKENPVTETMISLVKSVPVIGGLVDTTATVAINKIQEKKQKELIQCILQNSNSITSDQVKILFEMDTCPVTRWMNTYLKNILKLLIPCPSGRYNI